MLVQFLLVLQRHLLNALKGYLLFAERADCACHHPDLNAVCVEVVSNVTGQRSHKAVLSKVYQTNRARLLIFEHPLIPGRFE